MSNKRRVCKEKADPERAAYELSLVKCGLTLVNVATPNGPIISSLFSRRWRRFRLISLNGFVRSLDLFVVRTDRRCFRRLGSFYADPGLIIFRAPPALSRFVIQELFETRSDELAKTVVRDILERRL